MNHLFEFLLRQGDNTLVLGHRVSEWCGVAPVLEEDIALANTALDLIGQTQMWLGYAGQIEGNNRTANDLAYLRDAYDFRNLLMLEKPNHDFGHTIMRQFLFDAFQVPFLHALENSADQRIGEIAAKSVKEAIYHLERSRDTVIALGDGTEESNKKMQDAVDLLWPYTGEMFSSDETDNAMAQQAIAPKLPELRNDWEKTVKEAFNEGMLAAPQSDFFHKGGKNGQRHSEDLGHMLAAMQILQRSYPGAAW